MSKSFVTIFTPVYNGEKYLKESIESVLNQTYEHFEYIIINDGSTDASDSIIRSYNDSRIHYYSNEGNKGLFFTRDLGVKLASGDYFAILDCDDIMSPKRLEEQIEFFNSKPDYSMVCTRTEVINESSKVIDKIKTELDYMEINTAMIFMNPICNSSVMIKTDIIKGIGYTDKYPPAEDFELWTKIALSSKIGCCPKYLTKYREHSANITHRQLSIQENNKLLIIDTYLQELNIFLPTEIKKVHNSILSEKYYYGELKDLEQWYLELIQAIKSNSILTFNNTIKRKLIRTLHWKIPSSCSLFTKVGLLCNLGLLGFSLKMKSFYGLILKMK